MNGEAAASTAAAAAAAAAEDPGESLTVQIPDTCAVAIHFPGFINPDSTAAALDTFGGEAGLSTALGEQPAFLKLRLRPDDPYSHPLFGERRSQQNGLLLRIARPKGQPDAAPAVCCVARVAASYAYNGLADYQFLGHDPQQQARHNPQQQQQQQQVDLSGSNLPVNAEPLRRPGPLLLLPPLFSKVDVPVAYGFKDTTAAAAAAVAATGAGDEAGAGPKTSGPSLPSEPRIISFYSPTTPAALPLPPDSLTPQQAQHLPRLQALLQQRPALHTEALLGQLPGCSEVSLRPLLLALCYQFKTGPWKSLWVCCGCDPRDNLDGRRYQILQYRLPTEWARLVRAARQAGTPMQQPPLSALCSFSAMPVTHSTPLQLCDLQDEAIRQLVASAPVTHNPSEAYGWFTYASSQQLQQALNMAFSKALQAALAQQQQQQQQQQQSATAAAAGEGAAGEGEGAQMEVVGAVASGIGQPAQQQQQREEVAAAAAVTEAAAEQPPPAAAAAAAAGGGEGEGEGGGEDLVGLLGLGDDHELRAFLEEAAAAAEQRQQSRAAAAAAAAVPAETAPAATTAAAGGPELTDGGMSGSDWDASSAGETTAGEETDGLTSDGDWDEGDASEDVGGLDAYNEDV